MPKLKPLPPDTELAVKDTGKPMGVARYGLKTLDTNPDLTEGGEDSPRAFWRNLNRYGFTTPKQEFIESAERPSMRELAQKWSVRQRTLYEWSHTQKWEAERSRFWKDVLSQQQELMKGDLAELRAKSLVERIRFWKRMRQSLEALASRGYIEENSPTGGKIKREFAPKDLKDMAAVAEKIDSGEGGALGFTQAMLRELDAEDDGIQTRSVKQVVYREVKTVTVTEKTDEALESAPAIPALHSGEEAVEAEVEGDSGEIYAEQQRIAQ